MEPSSEFPLCSRALFHTETDTRWDLQRLLGHGHFAQVWSGVRWSDGSSCAIKCLSISLFTAFKSSRDSSLDIEDEPMLLERLHHTNVVPLLEWFQTRAAVYMVLEFAPAGDLKRDIIDNDAFTHEEARRLFQQVLAAVRYIHHVRVAHRDVKPENILLTTRDRSIAVPKLCDFGLARATLHPNACLTVCGTAMYLAPEIVVIARGNSSLAMTGYDYRVDMWSLGVTLCVLLWAAEPFGTEHLFDDILAGRVSLEDRPTWVSVSDIPSRLVRRLLCFAPHARASADEASECVDAEPLSSSDESMDQIA